MEIESNKQPAITADFEREIGSFLKIEVVETPAQAREFLLMPISLYKNDPNYIRPLDEDVESVFDPQKNSLHNGNNCRRWLLRDIKGNLIGRIAAFINPKKQPGYERTGGSGFFECINDQQAADMLFNTAKEWLAKMGMDAMDGPINFGERDKWWGLLADGFTPPNYCCNYNPPYYRALFENYGFEVFFKQYTYIKDVGKPQPQIYYTIADRLLTNPAYQVRQMEKKNLDKYCEDFRTIYNKAWVLHDGVEPMSRGLAQKLIKTLKPVIDERIAFFAYYNQQPIGFFLCLPELNELLVKHVNGRLNFTGKMKLFWNKLTDNCKTMYGIVFGVIPEFQRKGVEAALIVCADRLMRKAKVPYTTIQMNWVGDFNPRMMKVAEQIDGKIYKTHHTYRYLFDREKPFERMKELTAIS